MAWQVPDAQAVPLALVVAHCLPHAPQFPLSLALKDLHLALEAADEDRFAALACLADEWQGVVDQGLGDQDLTVVTRALELQEGAR